MVGGLDNTSTFQGDQKGTTVPNVSGDAWRKPLPTVEEDATIGAPPSGGQQQSQQPWRAGYNGVAPIFPTGGDTTQPTQQPTQQPWRAGYNGVAPIFNGNGNGNGSDVQDPNRNGNQSNGPVWHAPTKHSWLESTSSRHATTRRTSATRRTGATRRTSATRCTSATRHSRQ